MDPKNEIGDLQHPPLWLKTSQPSSNISDIEPYAYPLPPPYNAEKYEKQTRKVSLPLMIEVKVPILF